MIEYLVIIPILLFSVVVHEVAHGWAAMKLGDPTAKLLGRLTLNPIPHIDLVGSIIVPLFSLMAAGQVFIAWAKPVPVNPLNFRHMRRDDIIVSAAGPASNLVMALLCSLMVVAMALAGDVVMPTESAVASEAVRFLYQMFSGGVVLNVVLAVFNLIPVPPLDGSHILASVLPAEAAGRYRSIGFFGIFILIFLLRVPAIRDLFHAVIEGTLEPFRMLIELFI